MKRLFRPLLVLTLIVASSFNSGEELIISFTSKNSQLSKENQLLLTRFHEAHANDTSFFLAIAMSPAGCWASEERQKLFRKRFTVVGNYLRKLDEEVFIVAIQEQKGDDAVHVSWMKKGQGIDLVPEINWKSNRRY